MKYGDLLHNKIKVNLTHALTELEDKHSDSKCTGAFRLVVEKDGIFSETALGPVMVSNLPVFKCPKCGANFIAHGFDEWIETNLVKIFVTSPGVLDKRQLRFLREFFDMSQEDVARVFDVSSVDRHAISKYESVKSERMMPQEKQTILKLWYQKQLQINDAGDIFKILPLQDKKVETPTVTIPKDLVNKYRRQTKAC